MMYFQMLKELVATLKMYARPYIKRLEKVGAIIDKDSVVGLVVKALMEVKC